MHVQCPSSSLWFYIPIDSSPRKEWPLIIIHCSWLCSWSDTYLRSRPPSKRSSKFHSPITSWSGLPALCFTIVWVLLQNQDESLRATDFSTGVGCCSNFIWSKVPSIEQGSCYRGHIPCAIPHIETEPKVGPMSDSKMRCHKLTWQLKSELVSDSNQSPKEIHTHCSPHWGLYCRNRNERK